MNKRIVCLILAAALLTAALCGCGSEQAKSEPPVPGKATTESSENSFGARYVFQLYTVCKMISDDLKDLGVTLDKKDWETISSELADDHGVGYSSLCNRKNVVTFTAAVENDSGKVMNFGCGCLTEKLKEPVFRSRFLGIAATAAQYTGGFEEEDRGFLTGIFARLLDGDEEILAYEGILYIKSVDEGTTVLITAPCGAEEISEKKYKEYTG